MYKNRLANCPKGLIPGASSTLLGTRVETAIPGVGRSPRGQKGSGK